MNNPKVAILLCTYNGERFLAQQLDSIISQTHKNWVLFVSDDGSTDDTVLILKEYQQKFGISKIKITNGPRKGFARNFLNLLSLSGNDFEFYAFCDQDDIWLNKKLTSALLAIEKYVSNTESQPVLYGARTILIDESNEEIGFSPYYKKTPNFNNALVQNFAGGNTMILNKASKKIVCQTPENISITFHDWWVYLCIAACDGIIIYDSIPNVRYRQHKTNLIGLSRGSKAISSQIKKILNGDLKKVIELNLLALENSQIPMALNNRKVFFLFKRLRQRGVLLRLYLIFKIKVFRLTTFGTIALYLAILLGKI